MALIKAQCTNCGGALEVDSTKDAAVCPFCNTPFIVEKAINLYKTSIVANGATINISGILDADTMFENWLVTRDEKLKNDFHYYYPTDFRDSYIQSSERPEFWIEDSTGRMINSIFVGPRFEKYKQAEMNRYTEARENYFRAQRQAEHEEKERDRLIQSYRDLQKGYVKGFIIIVVVVVIYMLWSTIF